jgi:hypothetical protein
VGPRAGLDRRGKSRPHRDRCPDRPARSQLLYRLRYVAHIEWVWGGEFYWGGGAGKQSIRGTELPIHYVAPEIKMRDAIFPGPKCLICVHRDNLPSGTSEIWEK